MSFDPLRPDSDTPKNGDFAAYVEELVHRRGNAGAAGSAPAQRMAPGTGAAASQRDPVSAAHDPVSAARESVLNAARPLIGKLCNVLLALGIVWMILGLGIEIPFFADSIPIGLILIVGSFFIRNKFGP